MAGGKQTVYDSSEGHFTACGSLFQMMTAKPCVRRAAHHWPLLCFPYVVCSSCQFPCFSSLDCQHVHLRILKIPIRQTSSFTTANERSHSYQSDFQAISDSLENEMWSEINNLIELKSGGRVCAVIAHWSISLKAVDSVLQGWRSML